jgi:hemerythrin-like domain-containing protein
VTFNPFPAAAPDFDDPLGLLRACHGRIAGHCDLLLRLIPHLATRGADGEAHEAMARVQRYFSTAAQHHHEDEERDLFPLLRGRDATLDRLMDELKKEHEELAGRWTALQPLLAAPERAADSANGFAAVVERFVAGYQAHAGKENDHLLPRAAGLLGPDELQRLGAAMAARRRT